MSATSDLDLVPAIATRREDALTGLGKMVSQGLGWARKYSLFQYPFVTACCGMEYMSLSMARYDLDRFGALFPRFSPSSDANWQACCRPVARGPAPCSSLCGANGRSAASRPRMPGWPTTPSSKTSSCPKQTT